MRVTGRELWHYQYPANTGSTIGNRGVGMYGNWLFFESPDSHLVSLDARTGKERWKVEMADPKLDYTSTVAPVIIGNHVILGIGGDHLDNPGFHRVARSGNRRSAMEAHIRRRAKASRGSRPGRTNMPPRTAPGRRGYPALTIRN